ncbi:MAG: cation-transporting P-type ATPase [Nakamurella multipartita]
MTATAPVGPAPTSTVRWYALPVAEVSARLRVDPAAGLSAATAAQRTAEHGPSALPAEKPPPGWRRFLASTPRTCRSAW